MFTVSLLLAGLLFTTLVFVDQIVIVTNRLAVLDRIRLYSNRLGKRVRKRAYVNFKYTFGGEFNCGWFLPIAPRMCLTVESLYN